MIAGKFTTTNNSPNFWASYAKQVIDFQHALGELIDNALSAGIPQLGGIQTPVYIEVTLEEQDNGNIKVQVADNGKGINKNDLTSENNVFNLGYRPHNQGHMNEHGFGLKNALALLTSGFQTNFSLMTKTKDDSNIYLVKGPIQHEMEYTTTTPSEWNDGLEDLVGVTNGVKVSVEVKFEYFSTLYSRRVSFDNYVRRLGEHLGVMYHQFINKSNIICVRYKAKNAKVWSKEIVPAINTPFLQGPGVNKLEQTIYITHNGSKYKAKYIQGILDTELKDNTSEEKYGWPYPLRVHYQGSNARCGITLVVRGRVLKTAVFQEVWPKKAGDVSFNNFIAELHVDDTFDTTNNKTDLDPHSEVWRLLREKLSDDFPPEKNTKKQSEDSLRKKISEIISVAHDLTGKDKPSKKTVWHGGAEIDIYYQVNKKPNIMELKIEQAKVKDLYQLVMYWDGIVEEEKLSPSSAILVAASFPTQVMKAINHVNSLKDKLGNNYNITTKEVASYSLI